MPAASATYSAVTHYGKLLLAFYRRAHEQPVDRFQDAVVATLTRTDFAGEALAPYRRFLCDFGYENFVLSASVHPVTGSADDVELLNCSRPNGTSIRRSACRRRCSNACGVTSPARRSTTSANANCWWRG